MQKLFKSFLSCLFVALCFCFLCGCNAQLPIPPEKTPGEETEKPTHEHVVCPECGKCTDKECPEDKCAGHEEVEESIKDQFDCISIKEALDLAQNAGDAGTSEKYYVYGIIKTVSNGMYGEMTITDGEYELYVYGVYSADGQTRYDALTDKPVSGDEVVLYGMLKTYQEKPEMDRGFLQAFNHIKPEVDETLYQEVTIAEARSLEASELVKVTGVVARITYANGFVPNGFYLVDETESIYVYGNDAAGSVKIGNTVTLVGEKTYYVLASEQSNADKHGYKGCCQIQKPQILENDLGNSEYNKEWISESTIKDIVDASVLENNTTTIYKVTALVKKAVGTGFTNYYFNDLDGVTGSYTYTSCSGSDFSWLDEFDGKICTVYLSPINYKSTSSGCIVRFIPIEVIEEEFSFDLKDAPSFALKYYAVDQFLSVYEADPELNLKTSVDNEILGFSGLEFSYASSNEDVCYFENTTDGVVLHTKNAGSTTITITAKLGEYTDTCTVEVEYKLPSEYETITVKEAIDTPDDQIVTVRGIVASSLVNQSGFYLIDETGVIAVTAEASIVSLLSSGDEVIVRGTKDHKVKDGYAGAGQINIYNAEILVNYYGNHEYSTATFDATKTLNELYEYNHMEDHSNEVYVVKAVVKLNKTAYYTNLKLLSLDGKVEFTLYSASANQYEFLHQFDGQEITIELALCNWNSKNYYAGCVISVITEDGKIINTLNFEE